MPLDEAYLVWLYSQVGSVRNRNRSKTYWSLLRLLYRKEFIWSIPMDENRAHDGRDLRGEFLRDTNNVVDDPDWMSLGCSILELMVALSRKLAFDGGGEPRDWFWDLINNLGLSECTDANGVNEDAVEHILEVLIHRQYAENGAGGLFPLTHPQQDQRNVELWYQAQGYLLERF